MSPRAIVVTGSSGFVGSALVEHLLTDGRFSVIAPGRMPLANQPELTRLAIDTLDSTTNWDATFGWPVAAVIHCAARVHVMNEAALDPLAEFRRVNVQGTLHLARRAAAAGVKRFIFLSSIKVNGEATSLGGPFTPDVSVAPTDPYGLSKWEAEVQLRALAVETGMEVVVIRPVLVYGPGVKANFRSLMNWLVKGVPLPFGAVDNCRSLVSVFNLVDLLIRCIDHPGAAQQTFLVSDGEDVSTPELLSRLGAKLGRPPRLLAIPPKMLYLAAAVLGKRAVAERVCGSLQVDIDKTRERLGWSPVMSLDTGLQLTVAAFLESKRR